MVTNFEIPARQLPNVLYDVSTLDTNRMLRLIFKHRARRKQTQQEKYKG